MKLHSYWRSSAAFRARIAANLKGLSLPQVAHHLARGEQRAPEYLALNPQGLVPALETDAGVIGQSIAIIEYLDETFPAPPLLPREPLARAQVRSMALGIACDIHPLGNLRVLNYLRGELRQPEEAVGRWIRHWIEAGFAALENAVRRHSADGRHCHGSEVTLADICLVPQMYNARRFNCDLAAVPTLVAIDAALREQPAFAAAAPERQPDAGS
ncbi:MAG: Maleylpyruvate isomerase [Steroidobacteraceae bacterium]|nr:Maleylpyruvate isomerase [Steroidobacteraceae bacterium]